MRLIDADEAIRAVHDEFDECLVWDESGSTTANEFENIILQVPTVDIDAITESHERIGYDRGFRDGYAQATSEVRHGHWVEVQRIHEADHTAICECSLCGDTVWVYDGQRAWNYCPNCGAKMDEVEE